MAVDFEKLNMCIHHVAISVPSLDDTIAWYKDKLGFTFVSGANPPGAPLRFAHMQGSGFLLEIFERDGAGPIPEGRSHPDTDLQTHGMKHFSIGVDDARSFLEKLQSEGVKIVSVIETDDVYGAFILDNTGNLIEIIEN